MRPSASSAGIFSLSGAAAVLRIAAGVIRSSASSMPPIGNVLTVRSNCDHTTARCFSGSIAMPFGPEPTVHLRRSALYGAAAVASKAMT